MSVARCRPYHWVRKWLLRLVRLAGDADHLRARYVFTLRIRSDGLTPSWRGLALLAVLASTVPTRTSVTSMRRSFMRQAASIQAPGSSWAEPPEWRLGLHERAPSPHNGFSP
jgi:hypothetical protein